MNEESTSIPELTDEQVEKASEMGDRTSSPKDSLEQCPECGEESLVARDDLEWEETRGHKLLVIRRLSGERCRACGETWFDPESYEAIEKHRRSGPAANYEAKVSRVGGSSLGIYFPKDLRRVMGIEAGQRARLTPVSDDAAILELKKGSEEGEDEEPEDALDKGLGVS